MSSVEKPTALIVGATGIVGRHLRLHLERTGAWNVLAPGRDELDLTDAHAVSKMESRLESVSHVFFAAYIEKMTLAEQTTANLGLMQSLIEGLEPIATRLQRVLFIQGGKAYGAHLGEFKTPAKETDARHFPPNFYYSQEDYLRATSSGKAWSFTAIRPDIIDGIAIGNPMNIANILAVYATLCRELRVEFRFPGTAKSFNALVNITSADVLAKALEWAALDDSARGEIFNITNGDIFRWKEIWPKIAKYFGVNPGEPLTLSLTEYMSDKETLWSQIADRHGLSTKSLKSFVQWPFGDFILNNRFDAFFDVSKARRFGFHEMHVDTATHLLETFTTMREMKLIP